ncbi:transcriptional regulator [Thermococcus sp. P6]|uniref:ArsR/SmtB family transcription factor n=1 Tax=Thermococcus sp. P6 TaxID=122420 RepID=UPI000B5A08D6|nr:helix-turn-helix domain-containing protein [Thermococcus sp. P6]ASJ11097.1 transcriptional regulator [Thermococcus sp. P6]
MDYETIDIHDDRARELAQILTNEKAIEILHLVEDRPLSISEISRQLDIPISTVSYHIDKMLRVGLVEVAGKKYGKRLQEVRLYRASNRPILLVPRKSVSKIRKSALGFERLHLISLSVAGLISAGVYAVSRRLLVSVSSSGGNLSVMSTPKRVPVPGSGETSTTARASLSGGPDLAVVLAIVTFVLTFLLASYILRRRT